MRSRLALSSLLVASMLPCACGHEAETAEGTPPSPPEAPPTAPTPPAPAPTPAPPATLEATSSAGWQITRYEGRDYGFHSIAFDVNSRGPVFALYTRTGLLIGPLAGPLEEVPGTEPHLDFTRAGVAFAFAQGGIPQAFFIDTARPGVGYVTRDGNAWRAEPVMGGESVALPHIAFDGAGNVHGAVIDTRASSITELTRGADGTWQTSIAARFTHLDAISDIARDARGELWMAACAHADAGSELSIFRLAATSSTPTPPMSVGTFEGRCGSEGNMPARFGFAFRADGTAHILVPVQGRESGGENGDALVHFASTGDLALGQAWTRTDVASIEFGACESTLAIDPQGELHAAFTKHRGEMSEPTELYYGAFLSESWRIERIDEDTRYRDLDAPSLHMRQTSIAIALRGHGVSESPSTIHLFQRPRR